MASIVKVGEKWRALIRRKGYPAYCKTFRVKAQAEAWARQIEADIDRGKSPAPAAVLGHVLLLRDVVQTYRTLRDQSRPISDSSNEHYMLRRLVEGLGDRDATTLTPHDLVGHCRVRTEEGAGPYTCNMEISKLGTVMRYAGAALKVTLPDVAAAARPLLSHLGLIGGGGKRERRPTEDELQAVTAWLTEHKGPIFGDIVRFLVATALRRGELVQLVWDDVDRDRKLLLVRDRKDPRRKAGNDQWIPLLPDAWEVLERQAVTPGDARIWPIGDSTISKYFTEACRVLSIPDLHLHDLRHEGTSRLFEDGLQIQEVAIVTG
ncbi:MAG: tyrosine-type recombinase/integrase, partial [Leptothrix sp. (in: b-proteobacteria)]